MMVFRPFLATLALFVLSGGPISAQDGRAIVGDLQAIRGSDGVQVLEQVELGGTPQWVSVRGKDRSNPVLLFLHGGPGDPGIGLSWAFQRSWEEFFTVVQWDQRGGGKNVSGIDLTRRVPDPDLTIDRLTADAEELVAHLRDRFQQDRILVVGHSWGTVLGTRLALRRPQWLRAFVAIGHVGGSMRANEAAVYEALVEEARIRNDSAAAADLAAIAPYPPRRGVIPPSSMAVRGRLISTYGGSLFAEPDGLRVYFSQVQLSPDYDQEERENWAAGASRVIWHLANVGLFDVDLEAEGLEFEVPVFFFHGRHDLHTPMRSTRRYFEAIDAPQKDFLVFERSAHSPHLDEPGLFLDRLRGVAHGAGGGGR